MKNLNKLGKRLLALLIAVVMVVGQIPFGAVATESTVTTTGGELFKISMKKEVTGATDNGENVYTYTVTYYVSQDGGVAWTEQSAVDAAAWNSSMADDGGSANGNQYANTLDAAVSHTASYHGKTVTVTANADKPEAEELSSQWTVSEPSWGDVYAGAAFTFPAAPSVTEGTVEEGYTWSAQYSGDYEEADGKFYANASGTVSVTYTLAKDENNIATTVTSSKTIAAAPSVTSEVKIGGVAQTLSDTADAAQAAIKWHKNSVDIVATVNAGADLLEVNANFPQTEGFGTWTKDPTNPNLWNAVKTVAEDTMETVSVGGQFLTVGVETAPPTVNILRSYDTVNGTKVEFEYTVGLSGVASIMVNDTIDVTSKVTGPVEGVYTLTLEEKTKNVAIVVNSVARNSSEKKESVSQDGLAVSFAYTQSDSYKGIGADGRTYDPAGEILVKVTGTDANTYKFDAANTVVVATDVSGAPISVAWNNNADETEWTFKISTANGLNELSVTPVDAKRSGETFSYSVPFGVDNTDPSDVAVSTGVSADAEDNAVKYYNAESVTYTVSVNENLLDCQNSYVKLTINGEVQAEGFRFAESNTGVYTAAYTVPSGSIVSNIEVYAVDKYGNDILQNIARADRIDHDAPKVSFAISDNIKQFYTDGNGQIYAVLDPAIRGENPSSDAETEIIALTVTIEDLSMLESGMAGWTANENKTAWTRTFSVPVDKDSSGILDFEFTVADRFGQVPAGGSSVQMSPNAAVTDNKFTATVLLTPDENGKYDYAFKIDRRTPDNVTELVQAPEITITAAQGTPIYTTQDNVEVYTGGESGQIQFQVKVDDIYQVEDPDTDTTSASQNDSGVDIDLNLGTSIEDGELGFLSVTDPKLNENMEATVTVSLNGQNETDAAELRFSISDEVGNTYYFVKYFAVDNLGPRVNVSYEDKGVHNESYFDDTRTATIEVTDLYFVADNMTINSTGAVSEWTASVDKANTYVATIHYGEGNHTFSISGTDFAINPNEAVVYAEGTEAPNAFTVDLTNPKFTVLMEVMDNKTPNVNEETNTAYYNAEAITYTVSVQDNNLDSATVNYVIANSAGVATEGVLELASGESKQITLTNGMVLTHIDLQAEDKADRFSSEAADLDSVVPFVYDEENQIWNYAGSNVVVDTDPAVVRLTKKGGELVNQYQLYDYYNDTVTYNLDIEDSFLDAQNGQIVVTVNYTDKSKDIVFTMDDLEAVVKSGKTVYSTKFTIEDGQCLKSMSIKVVDNAGNVSNEANDFRVSDPNKLTNFKFNEETQTNNYSTLSFPVVDATAPVATLTIDGNVESFYTFNGVAYVKLANPAEGMSGALADQGAEKVSMTIKVEDKNLTLDTKNGYAVKDNNSDSTGEWSGNAVVNTTSTLTYYDEITVEADQTGYFTFDLTVVDLAGNVPEEINVTPINNTDLTNLEGLVAATNGKFGTTISVDRRRPSTVTGDNNAPVITIAPTIQPATSSNDLELFNGAFYFNMTVTDGEAGNYNSGLGRVEWKLEDAENFVYVDALSEEQIKQDAGTYTNAFTIPIKVNGVGESNSAKLTITATDNVGNTTTYVKEFAVDNEAPRVTVSFDNNSVLNGKYFKDNRTVTITVDDINFDAGTTTITTQVGATGWSDANPHVASCTYSADGEYTFAMATTDKAGNVADIDITNGGRNASADAFVVDKTAPVISVTYNPTTSIGTDGAGVHYYDQDVQVSVAIREVNFRAGDVRASMGANNSLSGWYSNGSNHTSSTTYTEGNNYSFSIAYTDLAGNPAVAYSSNTFSVDTHAPTIEMTKGDMKAGEMNPVQDNLVLGFTINDTESNLKNYEVKVIHTDNEFKETVVSGDSYYSINDAGDKTTVTVDFANIAKEKDNDGIYTVQITAEDYSGHVVSLSPDVTFSLNRFGSTFMTDDAYTNDFLTPSSDGSVYQREVSNKLVVKEINPNRVWQNSEKKEEGSVITLAVNGNSIVLEKGVDYTVTVSEQGAGSNKWFVYTYEIDTTNFVDGEELVDGNYSILFYGEDEAGNKNTNESNLYSTVQKDAQGEYSGKMEFTLDHKAPVITTIGVEEGKSYNVAFQRLNITLTDNSPAAVQVYLNGEEVEWFESMEGLADNEVWLSVDPETGDYVLNIPESNSRQSLSIVATDAAGNSDDKSIENFMINTNPLIRAINNRFFVISMILLLLALIIFVILYIKKKKNKEAANA